MIRSEKMRWLLWLSWKLFLRSFIVRTGSGIARLSITGVILVIFFGMGMGVVVFTYLGYRLPAPANGEVLIITLTAVYVMWVLGPLLSFNTSGGLDLSKLLPFPLTRAELIASLLLSNILGTGIIWLVFLFAAILAGWSSSLLVFAFILLSLLVFYMQIIGMSQLIISLFTSLLLSRRFRDVATVLLLLFFSSCGVVFQFSFISGTNVGAFLAQHPVSPYLQWLPSGMAARAIQQAAEGQWGAACLWLGGLLAITLLVLYLWAITFERALTTPESGGSVRSGSERRRAAAVARAAQQPAHTSVLERVLPAQSLALFQKDIKYLRRDPQLLMMFIQSLLSLVIVLGYFFFIGFARHDTKIFSVAGPIIMFIIPVMIVFSLFMLSYNTLGYERAALATLLCFPIQPKQVLFGKNLVVFLVGGTEILVLLVLAAIFGHAWHYFLPALTIGFSAILLVVGGGNFTSVFFPQFVPQVRRGTQASTNMFAGGGCLRMLLSSISMYATFFIISPVVAAMIIPIFMHLEWIWLIAIPLSLVYASAIYFIVTIKVAPRILKKAPELLEVVTNTR